MVTLRNVYIFLSVSVNKGEDDHRTLDCFWSDAEETCIKTNISTANAVMLNPNSITIAKKYYKDRYVADLEMLLRSDLLIVDARTKKGVGVGAEMVIAKYEGIPVYTLCPDNSHYRKVAKTGSENVVEWIHPFIFGLSYKLFLTVQDVASQINDDINNNKITLNNGVARTMDRRLLHF